jgi:U3 small nucleolar RNA-associated protein 4
VVAGGTDGCLHVWNVDSGREVTRITVDGVQGNSPPCIWSVLVLQDGTIVSGDSLGQVTFWDGRFGTMVAKFNPHGVDVLALEKSADGEFVFATGVDPRISMFKRVAGGDRVEWAYVSSKQEHALDVRALCCCYDKEKKKESGYTYRLFSGGNDAVVVSHSVERFLKEAPQRMSLAPQRPHASMSRVDGGQIMAMSVGNMVNIWKCLNISHPIGKMEQYKDGEVVSPDSLGGMHPVHLARVSCSSGSPVTSVAVSRDGKYIACSDIHSLKCIELIESGYTHDDGSEVVPIVDPHHDDASMGMKMVQLPHHASTQGIVHMEFIPHSDSLVLFINDGTIRVVESLKNDDASSDVVIRDVHDLRYKTWFKKDEGKSSARRECPMIDVVSMSTSGQYIALTVRNRVFILSVQNRRIMTQIPSITTVKNGGHVAAMEFLENDSVIAIATSSGEIGLFDVSSGDMCALVGQDEARMHDLDLDSAVIGMTAASASSKSVMVYTANALCHVNFGAKLLDERVEAEKLGRRPRDKKLKLGYGKAATGRNCRVLPSQHPLLFVHYSDPNNLIVIQKPWEHVWKAKTAPLVRQTYGQ